MLQADGRDHQNARDYVRTNYPPAVAKSMLHRLTSERWKRDVVICSSCQAYVDEGKLGDAEGPRQCDYVVDPLFARADAEGQALWMRSNALPGS